MRLLARYPSLAQAEERAAYLRSRGIATHVSELTVLRPGFGRQARDRAAVWAVLAAQYDDALQLLEDPDHHPDSALDEEGMAVMDTEGPEQARRLLLRGLLVTLAVLLGALALVLWLVP